MNESTSSPRAPDTPEAGVVAPLSELVELRHAASVLGPTRNARAALAGPYRSLFRGRGVEFDELRAYPPGDNVRHIDWRVTARSGSVYSKLFQEERERPVWLLVDAGPSMHFGTRRSFKSVAAARAAALIGWSAQQMGDRTGGLVRSGNGLEAWVPRTGEAALFQLLGAISRGTAAPVDASAPSLTSVLARLCPRTRPGSRVFVLSDFYDFTPETSKHLAALARRADLCCVLVYDPLEEHAPPPGDYLASNGDGVLSFSSRSARWRRDYEAEFQGRRDALRTLCRKHGIQLLPLRTDSDPIEALASCLDPRRNAGRRGDARRRSTR